MLKCCLLLARLDVWRSTLFSKMGGGEAFGLKVLSHKSAARSPWVERFQTHVLYLHSTQVDLVLMRYREEVSACAHACRRSEAALGAARAAAAP